MSNLYAMITHSQQTRFLACAEAIGRGLLRDALWHEGVCAWPCWAPAVRDGQILPTYGIQATSLLHGTPGIALFLAAFTRHCPDPVLARLRDGAIAGIRRRVGSEDLPQGGLYDGRAALAGVLVAAGRLLNDPDLVETGATALADSAEAILGTIDTGPTPTDLLGGSAGFIPALLAAGRDARSGTLRTRLFDLAHRHRDHLIGLAITLPVGCGWLQPGQNPGTPPWIGLAQGNAGIALALARMQAHEPHAGTRETLDRTLAYERAWAAPTHGFWPDLRAWTPDHAKPGAPFHYPMNWGHGVVGIGAARLAHDLLGPRDPIRRQEQDRTIAAAAAFIAKPDHCKDMSIADGASGAATLVLAAGRHRGDRALMAKVVAFGEQALALYADQDLPWPGTGGLDTAGLMSGRAGIGWFFLDLAVADLPCLLLPPAWNISFPPPSPLQDKAPAP